MPRPRLSNAMAAMHAFLRKNRIALAALILGFAPLGCDGIFGTERKLAERAQIIITGQSAVPLTLVLSNEFLAIRNAETQQITHQLLSADTQVVSLPVDLVYPMGSAARVFIRIINADKTQTATLNLRVRLDSTEEVYNQNVSLLDSHFDYAFIYF